MVAVGGLMLPPPVAVALSVKLGVPPPPPQALSAAASRRIANRRLCR
jgi:hypothetical protein